jgi:CPA2 family monovalent cation:H+ antiporter-2
MMCPAATRDSQALIMERSTQTRHTIIAGYGIPGRAVAEAMKAAGTSYCVIELNPTTVHRCELGNVPIIEGDCRSPEILVQARIAEADLFVIVIPDEKAAIEATVQAKRLNPNIRILTRCHYTSAGIIARASGADDVIVAEQVVAQEASTRVKKILAQSNS